MEHGGATHIAPALAGHPNGGFPEPPPGCSVRVLRTRHRGCGAETRLRLPAVLPPRAVRRFICQSCAVRVDAAVVEELELQAAPALVLEPAAAPSAKAARRLRFPDPSGRAWHWLSVPVAGAAVIGALVLLQGGGEDAADEPRSASVGTSAAAEAAAGREGATFVQGSGFSLALPAGWQRLDAGTATFSAAAANGAATVTVWVEHAPELDFAAFETQALRQLRDLAGNARVAERVEGPMLDQTIVRLAADAPPGEPARQVTLRSYGPYRYELSTTLAPDASPGDARAVRLLHGSLTPEAVTEEGG